MLSNAPWSTGMTVDQEVAALLSLATGTRIRSGGAVRRTPAEGGEGRPDYLYHRTPTLPDVAWTQEVLPGLAGRPFDRSAVVLLRTLPQLTPESCGTLVKAAAAYADALWIANSDPVQGWLRLVSAVETVADFIGLEDDTLEQQFRNAHPKAAEVLDELGHAGLVAQIADLMKDKMGAGAKYRAFLQKNLPPEPQRRPAEAERQVCWDWTVASAQRKAGNGGMKDALTAIYGHRSSYLHAGKPFPPPLVNGVPETVIAADGGESVYAERPPYNLHHGGGVGAAWRSKDVPMYLHVFEYIVSAALLTWWIEQTKLDPSSGIQDTAEAGGGLEAATTVEGTRSARAWIGAASADGVPAEADRRGGADAAMVADPVPGAVEAVDGNAAANTNDRRRLRWWRWVQRFELWLRRGRTSESEFTP